MFATLWSLLGDWWARRWHRAGSSRAGNRTGGRATTPYFPKSAGIDARPAAGAVLAPPVKSPETGQSLADTLGVKAVPVPAARIWVADPKARERTMVTLRDLQQIPALQSLARGFLQQINQPEVSLDELVAAIGKDSALCVRVLRMANSVLVASEQRIEDLDTAVQMLGVKRVRKVAQALFTLRDAKQVAEGFDWRHLWVHALGTAEIAEELERCLRSVPDPQLYVAALLHDVGKIVLSTVAQEDYRDILVSAWHDAGRLEELERMRLGVDHREAGVLFARSSGLSDEVVEVIAHHDRPEVAKDHRFEVALVTVANHLCKAYGLGFSGSRLDAEDGELSELSAWDVITETVGIRPDVEAVEADLESFVLQLREELRELREAV